MVSKQAAIAELKRRGEWTERDEAASKQSSVLSSIQGLLSGVNTSGKRLAHGVLQPLYESNLVSENTRKNFADMAKRREQSFRHYEEQSPLAANIGLIGGDIAGQLPLDVAGLGVAGKIYKAQKGAKYIKPAIGLGIGGGLYGAGQHVGEGESRLSNTGFGSALGAGFGAGAPLVAATGRKLGGMASGAAQEIGAFLGHEPSVKKKLFSGILPSEAREGIKNKKLAEKLGIELTPAEATGSTSLTKKEARIGSTEEAEKKLTQLKKTQKELQGESIQDLLNTVSTSKEVPMKKFREASQAVIGKKRAKMQEKAQPFYKGSEKQQIAPNKFNSILKDSNIQKAYKDVTTSSLYGSEIEGFAPNSVKILDLVKRNLDDKISKAIRIGKNDQASILRAAKNKLVKKLDEVSPKYKKARSIYSEDLPAIKALEETEIGKIAKMKDKDLKNVSKTIFDPQQTDINVMKGIKKEIQKENPEAWADIIKHEMQRRLTGKNVAKTGNHGSNFYDKILADDNTFNQFKTALQGNKEAVEKLTQMRSLFKNLLNLQTPKSVHGKAQSSLDVPRSTQEAMIKLANGLVGGRYDEAVLKIINERKWDRELKKVLENPKSKEQAGKLMKIFEKVSKASPAKSVAVSSAVRTSGESE